MRTNGWYMQVEHIRKDLRAAFYHHQRGCNNVARKPVNTKEYRSVLCEEEGKEPTDLSDIVDAWLRHVFCSFFGFKKERKKQILLEAGRTQQKFKAAKRARSLLVRGVFSFLPLAKALYSYS